MWKYLKCENTDSHVLITHYKALIKENAPNKQVAVSWGLYSYTISCKCVPNKVATLANQMACNGFTFGFSLTKLDLANVLIN